jgi:hypothetical protein
MDGRRPWSVHEAVAERLERRGYRHAASKDNSGEGSEPHGAAARAARPIHRASPMIGP